MTLRCRACHAAEEKLRRAALPDWKRRQLAEKSSAWHKAHPDKRRAIANEWARRERERCFPDHLAIGQSVRRWRKANKIPQKAIAALLGVNPRSVWVRELGRQKWTPDQLKRLHLAGWDMDDQLRAELEALNHGKNGP